MASPESFYSGRELETDVFGSFKKSKKFIDAYRAAAGESGYVTYGLAMDLIRQFGESDPTNPDKEFATDLRIEISERLGLSPEEEDRLKFYSAVGTPLDLYHGVDAWLEYELSETGERISLTMDVTKRGDKISEGHKADFIIPEAPEPESDAYLGFVEEQATEIPGQLKMRIDAAKRDSASRSIQKPTPGGARRRYVAPPSAQAK